MLTEDVRNALQIELRQLRAERVQIEKKIEGLAAVLADYDSPAPATSARAPKVGADAKKRESTPAAVGLSKSIRVLLGQFPSGMRTSDIVKGLVQLGGYEDSERFRRHINSELWRQKKQGRIKKHGKKYVLAAEPKDAVAGA